MTVGGSRGSEKRDDHLEGQGPLGKPSWMWRVGGTLFFPRINFNSCLVSWLLSWMGGIRGDRKEQGLLIRFFMFCK